MSTESTGPDLTQKGAMQERFTPKYFSTGNLIRRVIWNVFYALFFRPTPRPMHRWRAFMLRCFGAKLADNARVYSTVKIWAPWNLEMGVNSTIGEDTTCYSIAKIILKDRVVVSQGCTLCTGTHDYTTLDFPLYALPIVLEDKVWVCTESFIGPGVTVGEGAVIGARSVVVKDLPQWMVCAGNPCKSIKNRVMKD